MLLRYHDGALYAAEVSPTRFMVEHDDTQTKRAQAADLLKHSTLTYQQIAARVGCSLATVRPAAHALGLCRKPQRKIAP